VAAVQVNSGRVEISTYRRSLPKWVAVYQPAMKNHPIRRGTSPLRIAAATQGTMVHANFNRWNAWFFNIAF
jgi:hypothetical protein